jgi:hypothetical protein
MKMLRSLPASRIFLLFMSVVSNLLFVKVFFFFTLTSSDLYVHILLRCVHILIHLL